MKEKEQQRGKILVVDDNVDIVDLLQETIREHTHFETLATSDPRQAISLFDNHRIDVVILDMVMPHLNGIEVFQQLRNRSIHIPVIFLTGQGDDELKKEALVLGAFDFLSKPIRARDLLILVDEAFKTVHKIRQILAKAKAV